MSMPMINPSYDQNPSITSPGPYTNTPTTSPSVPLGEIDPQMDPGSTSTPAPSPGSQWSTGNNTSSEGTRSLGDEYVSSGGAGAGATGSSGGSFWDSIQSAVQDSGIGQPMGGTLFDNW